jgi:hypothetical protein
VKILKTELGKCNIVSHVPKIRVGTEGNDGDGQQTSYYTIFIVIISSPLPKYKEATKSKFPLSKHMLPYTKGKITKNFFSV